MRATILILLALIGSSREAEAVCVPPSFVGTHDSDVPTRGVLYVYDENGNEPKVSWHDGVGRTVLTKLMPSVENIAFDFNTENVHSRLVSKVIRIEYEGTAGSQLVVNRTTFSLRSAWRATTRPPRVQAFAHFENSWTCSSSDLLAVSIDQPTAAVRARWTFEGATTEWVMPAPRDDTSSFLQLGKIDCGGVTLRPSELARGGHLELIAIRVDGSEVAIAGLPETIVTREMRQTGRTREQRRLDEERAGELPVELRQRAQDEQAGDETVREALLAAMLGLLAFALWLPRVAVCFVRDRR